MNQDIYLEAFQSLLQSNLGLRSGQSVLIVTDNEPLATDGHPFENRAQVAKCAADAAQALGAHAEVCVYTPLGRSGSEPPLEVWSKAFGVLDSVDSALLDKVIAKQANEDEKSTVFHQLQQLPKNNTPEVMLALSRHSISHTRFRNWLGEIMGTRAATMPGFEPHLLTGVMQADWPVVSRRTNAVAKQLTKAVSATIVSKYQGDERSISLDLSDRDGLADTGLIHQPGDFGNLPGGEGFVAPVEQSAQGGFWAYGVDGQTRILIQVDQGRFASVMPADPSTQFLEDNRTDVAITNLAELGVGTNEKAADTASILEGEKILGTCHIAFGDNAGFGGTVTAPFHRDYIIPDATLIVRYADGSERTIEDHGDFQLEQEG